MRHCAPDELLDVAEGARSAASLPHLAACAACRVQVDELRALANAVGEVDVPEPPPQFWDQLSARVADAVAAQPPPARLPWSPVVAWTMSRPVWTAAAVAAVVAAALLLAPPSGPRAPEGVAVTAASPAVASGAAAVGGPAVVLPSADPASEPLLGFMEDLADGIDLDAALAAGWTLDSRVTDAAVAGLSGEEQVELQRLLREALAGAAGAGA